MESKIDEPVVSWADPVMPFDRLIDVWLKEFFGESRGTSNKEEEPKGRGMTAHCLIYDDPMFLPVDNLTQSTAYRSLEIARKLSDSFAESELKDLNEEQVEILTKQLVGTLEYGIPLAIIVVGSRLQKAATADSDYDICIIHAPHKMDLYKGDAHILTSTDKCDHGMEFRIVPIQSFVKGIGDNDLNMYELLYAPYIDLYEDAWSKFLSHRSLLVSEKLRSAIGFSGSHVDSIIRSRKRLAEIKFLESLAKSVPEDTRIGDLLEANLDSFDGKEHFTFSKTIHGWQVGFCGRTFVPNAPVSVMVNSVKSMLKEYGARTGTDEGVLRALSHSYRVTALVKAAFSYQPLEYPLDEQETFVDIKRGKYSVEEAISMAQAFVKEVTDMEVHENVPSEPNTQVLDLALRELYENVLK